MDILIITGATIGVLLLVALGMWRNGLHIEDLKTEYLADAAAGILLAPKLLAEAGIELNANASVWMVLLTGALAGIAAKAGTRELVKWGKLIADKVSGRGGEDA